MPGVPSSRGCEACRKQKKRCDQQQPTCSRCKRLHINCVGSGQQRFKFTDPELVSPTTNALITTRNNNHIKKSKSPSKSPRNVRDSATPTFMPRPPSSPFDVATANALVAMLEVTDIRFDLTCYGAFLREIPRRLGKNKALDASTSALIVAFPRLHTHVNSVEALTKYGSAIRQLRVSLGDPEQAQTTETLIAIYLLIICQGWIGSQEEHGFSHGPGMAHILNAVASKGIKSDIDKEVFATLCVPVIMERMYNPSIQLDSWFWNLTAENGPKRPIDPASPHISGLRLQDLAKMIDYIREPEKHMDDVEYSYNLIRTEGPKMRKQWDQHLLLLAGDPTLNAATAAQLVAKLARGYQTAYALLLGINTVLNAILRAVNPFDLQLATDIEIMVTEIMVFAEEGLPHRPLGASHMPMCLVGAWVASDDPYVKAECERFVAEYQMDFAESGWTQISMWLQTKIDGLRLRAWRASMGGEVPLEVVQEEDLLEQLDLGQTACTIL